MKKALSLILALVFCLSLCACGGNTQATEPPTTDDNSAETAILGEWKNVGGGSMTFHEDGTGIAPYGDSFDWRYDKESTWYYVSYQGVSFSFTIKTDNDLRYITLEGLKFYHIDDFDSYFATYSAEKLAQLTEGRTELTVGNTYTTEDGTTFSLDKAVIHESSFDGEAIGMFGLYITSESNVELGDEEYNAPGRCSGFGLACQSSEGNTRYFAGGFEALTDLEEDRNTFGILSFTINGTAYYMQLESFAQEAPTDAENNTISHPLVEEVCGVWNTTTDDASFKSLQINADGTCVVDGTDAVWKIEEFYTNDSSLSVYVYVNDEACFGIWYVSSTGVANLTQPGDTPIILPCEAYKA